MSGGQCTGLLAACNPPHFVCTRPNAGEGSDLPSPASVIACHSQIDMSPTCRSHFYDSPNLRLLPGLGDSNEWFEYLKEKKLRTYFVRAATTICAFALNANLLTRGRCSLAE